MKLDLQRMISSIVLFCFLAVTFHSHSHIDHINEEFIENIVDYKDDLDHPISKKCDNCLIKNNKSVSFYIIEEFCNPSPILFKNKSDDFLKCWFSYFNIYGRPPPASIS